MIIVMGDLGGISGTFQLQMILQEPVAKILPVNFRISHTMSIKIPRSAAKFGITRNRPQLLQLITDPFNEHADLLSQISRGSRLSMRLGQHRNSFPFLCQAFQPGQELFQHRVILVCQGVLNGTGNCGIIDIL